MIYKRINKKLIDSINNINSKIIIELENTKYLNSNILHKIKNSKCYFKIYGGINDIEYLPRYGKRVTYSLKDIKKIINAIEDIERGMPSNKMDILVYIYDYIRKSIKYCKEVKKDSSIRSLKILLTKKAVCSGYSLLLKELLERQNIKCQYIKYYNHIWNRICIDRKYYEVDITWDACVYERCASSNFHFFANNRKLNKEHHGILNSSNYLHNYLLKDIKLFTLNLEREDRSKYKLTMLPIGIRKKYYLYEEANYRRIISSDDDFEIIYSRMNSSIVSSYVNCFFTKERINKYFNNSYSYLGYGIINNKCFYRKKGVDEKYINRIDYSKDKIVIDSIEGSYEISNDYEMREV